MFERSVFRKLPFPLMPKAGFGRWTRRRAKDSIRLLWNTSCACYETETWQ